MASNILEKKNTFSLVGLSLHLICQVLPPFSSIQMMQIKHFTDSLGLDLTNIYTCGLSKLSYITHRHTSVCMHKYLPDGRINVPNKNTKSLLVYPLSLYPSLHMWKYLFFCGIYFYLNALSPNRSEGIQFLWLSFITRVEKTVFLTITWKLHTLSANHDSSGYSYNRRGRSSKKNKISAS